MVRGLDMNADDIGTSFGEVVNVSFWFDDHEVNIDRELRSFADGAHHHRADRDVGHEAPIHDIDVNPVGTGGFDRLYLLGDSAEIGCEDGWGNLDHGSLGHDGIHLPRRTVGAMRGRPPSRGSRLERAAFFAIRGGDRRRSRYSRTMVVFLLRTRQTRMRAIWRVSPLGSAVAGPVRES